jgi:DNA-binding PadR family transcriptional regulator
MTTEPLTHLSFQILLALADAERHGYGILKEIEDRSAGATSPSTGALYLALQRMEEEGVIEVSTRRPSAGEDQRRKYYRLTARGREVARTESARLAEVVEVARSKALLPEGGR